MTNERATELDGLRGISIILVMAFHALKLASFFTGHEVLIFITSLSSIGWLGVDIFFTLSGFLITSILLKTKDSKKYFRNFYGRRILRIFPLYYVFVGIMLAALPALVPQEISNIPSIVPFLLSYTQNWMYMFDVAKMPLYLAVTWSLAIEEQFYLIWPAVVYYTRREALVKIGVGLILLSFAYRAAGVLFWKNTDQLTNFFYFDTLTRFSEIVFGAILAALFFDPACRERIRRFSFPAFIVSFSAFVALCVQLFPALIPYYGSIPLTLWAYILIPLFSTSLIAMLLTRPEKSLLRGFFRNRVFVFFGKYSYSMYLIHMPIALLLLGPMRDTHIRGWKMYAAFTVLVYILTILGSLISWHFLEKHMLNLKKHFEY
jgi:peptidoglycan/LPS O-acetylase OafA/YrhL